MQLQRHVRLCGARGARLAPDPKPWVERSAVAELMAELPLKKLRNFGGKLGAELAELGCSTAGHVRRRPCLGSGV